MKPKHVKRAEAEARQKEWNNLSNAERLNRIMDRTGMTPEQVLNTREARRMQARGEAVEV